MTIAFSVLFLSINYVSFDQNNEKYFNYIGSSEQMTLKRGHYKIDIYGAQGGFGYGDGLRCGDGGKGAHVSAEFYITSENTINYYITVGGQGVPNKGEAGILAGPNRGGYNGGGSGGEDAIWNPSEDQNDGPGGGGGATDIRTTSNDYKTRLIVAAGGSGGTWWEGSPGGGLCGLKRNGDGKYVCSTNTNTVVSGQNKCININGIGGKGADSYETPRSGGGGGFCGGFSDNGEEPSYPFTSDSGSSYAKECQSNKYENELCFFNVVMNVGVKNENGMVKITRLWECKDENCLYCKDADNKCKTCRNNFLYYNDGCVSKCPQRTVQNGDHCYDCEEGCDVCTDVTTCTKCIDGYYLYNNDCLTKCPVTTTIGSDGKSCIDCKSPCYSCSGNENSCTYCVAGYHLYNNNCLLHCPIGTFVNELNCSLCNSDCNNCTGSADYCLECKNGFFFYNNRCYSNCNVLNNKIKNEYYGKNYDDLKCHKCSDQNCIDCSNNFNICDECSPLYYLDEKTYQCIHIPTEFFTNSVYFTVSNKFTKSDKFSFSKKFSNSDYFTVSNKFSSSNDFTTSNAFSETMKFTSSKIFSNSVHFTSSNEFSSSKYFTDSNIFSETNDFTFSNFFTKSEFFTLSNTFSSSNQFTNSMTFSTPFRFRTTISESQFKSYTLVRSVSFSFSFYLSEIYSLTMFNNEFSFISTNSYLISYFPYIIQFYSLTNRPTIIILELPSPKRITAEMLIGICCGSASIFFFSLAIIIMIYKHKYKIQSDDFSISDEKEIKNIPINNDKQLNERNNEVPKSDSEIDMNFWL